MYNVEMLKEMLDGKIDALHFDEAWLPHATFHDFYKSMHAIGRDRPRAKESMIFSTQSTHKLLAGSVARPRRSWCATASRASWTATVSTKPI